MLAHLIVNRNLLNQLVRQILRVRCHKADSLDALHFAHHPKKLSKGHTVVVGLAVGIHVLPQEHNFLDAVLCKMPSLLHDIGSLSRALPAAHVGNDTIAAEVVAAVHNIDTCFKAVFVASRKGLHNLLRLVPDIDHETVAHLTLEQKLGELIDVVGSEDDIHEAVAFADLLHGLRFLHHAAAQDDALIGMKLFAVSEIPDAAVHAGVGVLPHRAGVVNHQVRLLTVRLLIADLRKNPG